jgi:hypothetical protein
MSPNLTAPHYSLGNTTAAGLADITADERTGPVRRDPDFERQARGSQRKEARIDGRESTGGMSAAL